MASVESLREAFVDPFLRQFYGCISCVCYQFYGMAAVVAKRLIAAKLDETMAGNLLNDELTGDA